MRAETDAMGVSVRQLGPRESALTVRIASTGAKPVNAYLTVPMHLQPASFHQHRGQHFDPRPAQAHRARGHQGLQFHLARYAGADGVELPKREGVSQTFANSERYGVSPRAMKAQQPI